MLFFFLTFGSHVVAAVILAASLCVVTLATYTSDRAVLRRAVTLMVAGILVTAHQWIFILTDAPYINRSALEPGWKYDGRGISYVLTLFWKGEFFDGKRFPIITSVLLGALCYYFVYAKRIRAQRGGDFLWLSAPLFLLFLSLCCGRQLWGWLFNALPILGSLHVHRFSLGVHLFGIILASVGAGALLRWVAGGVAAVLSPRYTLLTFLFVVSLTPALSERAAMYRENTHKQSTTAGIIASNSELSGLFAALEKVGYGWTYIGSRTTWQKELRVAGYIPLDIFTVMRGIPTVGGILFHAFSLAGETLFDFNPLNRSHFELFGIRTVVAPVSWQGIDGFTLVERVGRYAVWTRDASMLFLGDDRFEPRLDYRGQTDMMRSFVQRYTPVTSGASTVISQVMTMGQRFSGEVILTEPRRIVAAVGYHPGWRIEVNGVQHEKKWVQPGFIAVDLPAGRHSVSFTYSGSVFKWWLLAMSFLLIGGCGAYSITAAYRSSRRRPQ
jgi:hypothetical protein